MSLHAQLAINNKPPKAMTELELVRISLKLKSVADQMRFLTLFQDSSIQHMVRLLTVGASFDSNLFETVSLIFSDFNKLKVRYTSLARKGHDLVRLTRDHKLR